MGRQTFLRWPGGKEWLWKHIKPFLINDSHEFYIEPFLGGGAIAIHYLKWCKKHNITKKYILSDENETLINAYIKIRDDIDNLIKCLKNLCDQTTNKELYYERRAEFNKSEKNTTESAALFIWLNANCWRGIWQVNKSRELNVPYGTPKKKVFSESNLRNLNELFQNVDFRCCPFHEIQENGLIYLDPPYIGVFQYFAQNPVSNESINEFVSEHRESRILISNNEQYKPPTNSNLVFTTELEYRVGKQRVRRHEYLYQA